MYWIATRLFRGKYLKRRAQHMKAWYCCLVLLQMRLNKKTHLIVTWRGALRGSRQWSTSPADGTTELLHELAGYNGNHRCRRRRSLSRAFHRALYSFLFCFFCYKAIRARVECSFVSKPAARLSNYRQQCLGNVVVMFYYIIDWCLQAKYVYTNHFPLACSAKKTFFYFLYIWNSRQNLNCAPKCHRFKFPGTITSWISRKIWAHLAYFKLNQAETLFN